MEFEDEVDLEAEPSETWELVSDPQVLMECVPGAKDVERVTEDNYRGTIERGVAGINLSLHGEVTLTDQNPPHSFSAEAAGEDENTGSRVDADANIELIDNGDTTTVAYVIDMDFTGRLATLGARMTKRLILRDINTFFDNVRDKVEESGEENPPT